MFVHTSSLSIDIEIDEPYVGNTKAPHHCIDQGKDDIRNEFFTNGNWVVIRFSEKQVVKYPRSCCKVIASVVARVAAIAHTCFNCKVYPICLMNRCGRSSRRKSGRMLIIAKLIYLFFTDDYATPRFTNTV